MGLRRARGFWLRLAYHRVAAFISGLGLLTITATLVRIDRPWESWLTDGLALVCGATGIALLVMAISGKTPDWVDDSEE